MSLFQSCKKFVEIDPPKNQLVTENVFQHNETANAAMLSVLGQMFNSSNVNPYSIAASCGLSADEFTNYNDLLTDVYINAINPVGDAYTNSFWVQAYRIVYYANSVYEGCEKSTALDPDVKKQLMGEALFVRAYWNFYLVNLYGDIPLALSTDYSINAKLPRTPTAQVYTQIINDLKSAQINLNEKYTGVDGVTNSIERIRPNKAVATALLARIYLYTGDFVSAEQQSSLLIDNSTDYALIPVGQVFFADSKEAIWQIMPTASAAESTQEGFNFIPGEGSDATPVTESKQIISPALLSAFESGDLRRDNWIGSKTAGGTNYQYPYKYKLQFSGSGTLEYSIIFRLAEQYLIRAEARNENNNLGGAIDDLNALRNRARGPVSITTPDPLPNLSVTLTKEKVKEAIFKERRVELFAEQGHRWLDLKRIKTIDAVMIPATTVKGGVWKTTHQLWPIPETEILNNSNLSQNPGYN